MTTGANGAAGASGTGPSAGYTLITRSVFTILLLRLTGITEHVDHVITYTLLFVLIKWIKFNLKIPNILTRAPPMQDCRRGGRPIAREKTTLPIVSLSLQATL